MGFLINTSEYLGIRVAMADALQRYAAEQTRAPAGTIEGQVACLQSMIVAACHENKLLGARADVVGACWADFIRTLPPQNVATFAASASAQLAAETPLQPHVANFGVWDAIGYFTKEAVKGRAHAFEQLAQQYGLIHYAAGDSLSQQLANAEARLRANGALQGNPRVPDDMAQFPVVQALFNSPYGAVKPTDLGHPLMLGHAARIDAVRASSPASPVR